MNAQPSPITSGWNLGNLNPAQKIIEGFKSFGVSDKLNRFTSHINEKLQKTVHHISNLSTLDSFFNQQNFATTVEYIPHFLAFSGGYLVLSETINLDYSQIKKITLLSRAILGVLIVSTTCYAAMDMGSLREMMILGALTKSFLEIRKNQLLTKGKSLQLDKPVAAVKTSVAKTHPPSLATTHLPLSIAPYKPLVRSRHSSMITEAAAAAAKAEHERLEKLERDKSAQTTANLSIPFDSAPTAFTSPLLQAKAIASSPERMKKMKSLSLPSPLKDYRQELINRNTKEELKSALE